MHKQSIRGFVLGAVIGLALWLVAALAIIYTLDYQPRALPYLWWSLGVLTMIAAVELRLTSSNEAPAATLPLPETF